MTDRRFSRDYDISQIGISKPPSTIIQDGNLQGLTESTQENPSENQQAISQISQTTKEDLSLVQRTSNDSIEDMEMRRELLNHILNGHIFEFYDFNNTADLENDIKFALGGLRRDKRAEFIENFETRVPMEEFENYLKQKRDRIVSLYIYQKCVAELTGYFSHYSTPKWADIVSSEYFKTQFLNNYIYAISVRCFNSEGFTELEETHNYLEEMFSLGSFDEFGANLLAEAQEEIKQTIKKTKVKFFDISEEYLTFLINLAEQLEKIKQNNWKFDKTDIVNLRNAYKYKNTPPGSAYPEIALKIKEAIIKYRNPSTISSGLLSSKDISQIAIALNITRYAMGNGGVLRSVDFEKLKEIEQYLRDVVKYKSGILTIQEKEILKQVVCDLGALTKDINCFGLKEKREQKEIMISEAKILGQESLNLLLSAYKQYSKPIAENSIAPTMIFDPLVLKLKFEEETRKTVEIDEKLYKEDVFYRKIKYVRESPAFDLLFSQRNSFDEATNGFYSAYSSGNIEKALEYLSKLDLPSPIKMQDFFDNDLERFLILEMAHFYHELKKQGVSFSQNIGEHLAEFERQKSYYKKILLRLSILSSSISNIFVAPEGTKNQTNRINSNYAEIKRHIVENAGEKNPARIGFERFLNDMESLSLQATIFDIGDRVYNFEIYSIDPRFKAEESFVADAKKFIENLITLASPRTFKPDYVLDKETFSRLEKAVKFAIELKLIFPSMDDSIISTSMVKLALKKFEG